MLKSLPWKKLILLGLLITTIVLVYLPNRKSLTWDNLASKEAALRELQDDHPVLVYGAAFAIYVAVTGLSLPGATGMSLLVAWYFGFWPALVLISFASTTGAAGAFMLSRYLFRDWLTEHFGKRLKTFNQALEREGAFYLFTLRLIPVVPFFVINLVMGLTPIRVRTFWWVSQIGMLAGTVVYVYAGSTLPGLADPSQPILSRRLIVAFAILGIFPLVVKKLMERLRPGDDRPQSYD